MEHKKSEHVEPRKKSRALGVGLIAGMAAGLAAGLFIKSDKGREMTAEAQKRTKKLRREIGRKLRDVKNLTKDKYAEIVEDIISHYSETKELAADQLADLKKHLLAEWEDVRAQLHDEDGEYEDDEYDDDED